jgi:hypothetical protein
VQPVGCRPAGRGGRAPCMHARPSYRLLPGRRWSDVSIRPSASGHFDETEAGRTTPCYTRALRKVNCCRKQKRRSVGWKPTSTNRPRTGTKVRILGTNHAGRPGPGRLASGDCRYGKMRGWSLGARTCRTCVNCGFVVRPSARGSEIRLLRGTDTIGGSNGMHVHCMLGSLLRPRFSLP